jgi:hypothetical protein
MPSLLAGGGQPLAATNKVKTPRAPHRLSDYLKFVGPTRGQDSCPTMDFLNRKAKGNTS